MDLKFYKLNNIIDFKKWQYMNNIETEYSVEECKVIIDRYVLNRGRDGVVIIGKLFLDEDNSIPYIQNYKRQDPNNV